MTPIAFIQNNTVQAVVWMIIHSLWQFTLIAVIMSVLLKTFQNKRSTIRYNIALGSLALALITAVATFMYYSDASSVTSTKVIISTLQDSQVLMTNSVPTFMEKIYFWIDLYRMPIFYTWMMGVGLFGLRFLFSIGYVEFLSRTAIPVDNEATYQAFHKINKHLNIRQSIHLGESAYVKSPMILGFLKPIILFPIGIINQLEISEVEAILAHEMAHFVRKDIYVNIVQTAVEVIFYYHPAIWWISTNIKVERENCCDELALKYVGNNIHYAKTLVKMQELYNQPSPSLALNFSNKNSFFSNRIKRILNMTQTRNYLKEKIVTSLVLLAIVMIFSKNLTGSTQLKEIVAKTITRELPDGEMQVTVSSDTMPIRKESITIQKKTNDQDVKIAMENGKVTNLEIDGKKIAEEDYDKYQDIISEVKPRTFGNGNMHMFYFDDKNMPEDLNLDFLKGHLGNLDKLQLDQSQMNEQWQKMQEQLNKMHFNFGNLDSMRFNFGQLDSMQFDFKDFAFPNMDELRNHPDMKFDFDGDFPNNFDFRRDFNDDFPIVEGEDINGLNEGITSRNFSDVIGNTLNRDGLLIPGQENKVELTGKYLKINGEKQPTNIWNKYKRIFEEQSGTTLQKKSKLEFKFIGKESKRKYRVY